MDQQAPCVPLLPGERLESTDGFVYLVYFRQKQRQSRQLSLLSSWMDGINLGWHRPLLRASAVSVNRQFGVVEKPGVHEVV